MALTFIRTIRTKPRRIGAPPRPSLLMRERAMGNPSPLAAGNPAGEAVDKAKPVRIG